MKTQKSATGGVTSTVFVLSFMFLWMRLFTYGSIFLLKVRLFSSGGGTGSKKDQRQFPDVDVYRKQQRPIVSKNDLTVSKKDLCLLACPCSKCCRF